MRSCALTDAPICILIILVGSRQPTQEGVDVVHRLVLKWMEFLVNFGIRNLLIFFVVAAILKWIRLVLVNSLFALINSTRHIQF